MKLRMLGLLLAIPLALVSGCEDDGAAAEDEAVADGEEGEDEAGEGEGEDEGEGEGEAAGGGHGPPLLPVFARTKTCQSV